MRDRVHHFDRLVASVGRANFESRAHYLGVVKRDLVIDKNQANTGHLRPEPYRPSGFGTLALISPDQAQRQRCGDPWRGSC
jgi:hypothetical protein